MTVITQRQQQPQVVTIPNRRRKAQSRSQKSSSGSLVVASLKASLVGGVGMFFLILASLIPTRLLACLIIPGFLVAWLSTGLLAGILAGDKVKNSYQGGKAGWMAGFWAGIYGGVIAMILAAFGVSVFGIPIVTFGQNVVGQFNPEDLQWLGIAPNLIALMARVFGMFVMVGVIGSLISGLFSSIGGMIYPKLSSN